MQDVYQPKGEFKNAKCALTIHNIAFQVCGACGSRMLCMHD